MSIGHVTVYTNEMDKKVIRVSENGTFRLNINKDGVVNLLFSGINHAPLTVPVLIPEKSKLIQMTVQLATYRYQTDFKEIAVIGDFNDFKRDASAIPMIAQKDGSFITEIKTAFDSLTYQLINVVQATKEINTTMPGDPIPGTNDGTIVQKEYGRYASKMKVQNGVVKLKFDPSRLLISDSEAAVKYVDKESETKTFADYLKKISQNRKDYTHKRLLLKKQDVPKEEVQAFVKQYNWKKFHEPVKKIANGNLSTMLKQAALVAYISEAGALSEMTHCIIDYSFVQDALKTIDPSSRLWEIWAGAIPALTWANKNKKLIGYEPYFERILNNHSNDKLKQNILSYDFSVAYYTENESRQRYIYDRLLKDFPDSDAAQRAKKLYAPERKIKAGNPVPSFQIASLENPDVIYSDKSLLGKTYLIDFWGTWCGPCMNEMPYLHNAFEKYQSYGFTILSLACDKSPENVIQFRKNKWKMPWSHGFLSNCFGSRNKNDMVEKFEVVGFPTAILVGPKGVILKTGSALREEKLENTLSQIFSIQK